MIITIAICLIAALIVLANYKALRNPRILALAVILTIGLLVAGISFTIHSRGEKSIYAAFMSPFLALMFLLIVRGWYKRKFGTEIILYMRGFYPIRYEERFVSRMEKMITFVITLLSVAIPVIILELI